MSGLNEELLRSLETYYQRRFAGQDREDLEQDLDLILARSQEEATYVKREQERLRKSLKGSLTLEKYIVTAPTQNLVSFF